MNYCHHHCLFWDRVSFCSIGDCPKTLSVEQAGLHITDIHLFCSWVLGLKEFATTTWTKLLSLSSVFYKKKFSINDAENISFSLSAPMQFPPLSSTNNPLTISTYFQMSLGILEIPKWLYLSFTMFLNLRDGQKTVIATIYDSISFLEVWHCKTEKESGRQKERRKKKNLFLEKNIKTFPHKFDDWNLNQARICVSKLLAPKTPEKLCFSYTNFQDSAWTTWRPIIVFN